VEAQLLIDIGLPWMMVLVMFGMGITLTLADFARLRAYPLAVTAGLVGQLLILPLVGMSLAGLWHLPTEFAIGLVVLAACPGGVTSNLVTLLARGNVALSITLTGVNSLVTVVTIPLYCGLALQAFIGADAEVPLPFAQTVLQLVFLIALPVGLGMLLRARMPALAQRAQRPFERFAIAAFILLIVAISWNEREDLATWLPVLGLATFTLNASMTVIGLAGSRLIGVPSREAVTLAIEVGIQNATLGMVVAATILDGIGGLDGQRMAVPSAIYGLVMFAAASALIGYGRLAARREVRMDMVSR